MRERGGPLKDLKVLELASVLAGPTVGQFFAELGATVIKVENATTQGDVTRKWKLSTESPETDISSYFSCANWGKYSIALNLRDEAGLEVVYDLARWCDVVIASYKPGDAEKLKVDYETLKQINPRIIYGHITGYGSKNPRAGYDAIIQAESGFTYMNGEPDGKPTKMPVALMDLLAAHQLKEGILLALLEREKTGEGKYIEVSLLQSGIASLANQATNWLVGGVIPQRMGSDHPNIVPYGTIFTTRDGGDIVLAVGTDKQFARLCAILGKPELAEDPRFRRNIDRVRNREELKKILADLIARWERKPLLDALFAESVPAGGVYNMKEVFEQPEAQEMTVEGTTSRGMTLKGILTAVFKYNGEFQQDEVPPPPHYAEHSREVLSQVLGYSEDRIKELINRGAVYAGE